MAIRLLIVLLLCLLAVPRPAAAQPAEAGQWAVTTSDFETRRGRLASFTNDALTLQAGDVTSEPIPREGFVRMDRGGSLPPGPVADDAFVLHLRDGDRLVGVPLKLGDKALTIRTALLGDVDVPLESLLALTRPAGGNRPWREAQPPADVVALVNGDRLSGFVSAIGDEKLTVVGEGGATTPVDLSAVRQVRFADPGLPPPETVEKSWRVTTAAGSLFTAASLSFDGGAFKATYDGRPVELAERDVAAVEQAGGPVIWLSDLYPSVDEQVPYLSASFPTRVNGLSEGSGRGFVVHSKSTLSFDVPPGYARFRVRYKVADAALRGDVSVRVLLDGEVVHAVDHLTAGQSPAAVDLPLAGAKQVTLEVGYGAGLDVQDQAEWIDPALIR